MGNMRELRIRNGWRVEISRTAVKRNPGGADSDFVGFKRQGGLCQKWFA